MSATFGGICLLNWLVLFETSALFGIDLLPFFKSSSLLTSKFVSESLVDAFESKEVLLFKIPYDFPYIGFSTCIIIRLSPASDKSCLKQVASSTSMPWLLVELTDGIELKLDRVPIDSKPLVDPLDNFSRTACFETT